MVFRNIYLGIVVLAGIAATSSAGAAPITFTAGDYDNTANTVIAGPTPVYNQTTGNFRDVIWWSINNGAPRVGSPDYIHAGKNLVACGISACDNGTGTYNALNFTGPAISGGQSYLTMYDTTPGDGAATKNVFDASAPGGIRVSADVRFALNGHGGSAGVVALYNEGQDALALLANTGGGNNADVPKLSLVFQSVGLGTTLASVNLGAGGTQLVGGAWYRVTMDLTVSGDTWAVDGSFHNHVDPLNPNSVLGSLITELDFSGSLSNPGNALDLTNPGEVGLVAQGNLITGVGCAFPKTNLTGNCTDNIGVSITNFEIPTVPEPATMAILGLGLAGLGVIRRRRAA